MAKPVTKPVKRVTMVGWIAYGERRGHLMLTVTKDRNILLDGAKSIHQFYGAITAVQLPLESMGQLKPLPRKKKKKKILDLD